MRPAFQQHMRAAIASRRSRPGSLGSMFLGDKANLFGVLEAGRDSRQPAQVPGAEREYVSRRRGLFPIRKPLHGSRMLHGEGPGHILRFPPLPERPVLLPEPVLVEKVGVVSGKKEKIDRSPVSTPNPASPQG